MESSGTFLFGLVTKTETETLTGERNVYNEAYTLLGLEVAIATTNSFCISGMDI